MNHPAEHDSHPDPFSRRSAGLKRRPNDPDPAKYERSERVPPTETPYHLPFDLHTLLDLTGQKKYWPLVLEASRQSRFSYDLETRLAEGGRDDPDWEKTDAEEAPGGEEPESQEWELDEDGGLREVVEELNQESEPLHSRQQFNRDLGAHAPYAFAVGRAAPEASSSLPREEIQTVTLLEEESSESLLTRMHDLLWVWHREALERKRTLLKPLLEWTYQQYVHYLHALWCVYSYETLDRQQGWLESTEIPVLTPTCPPCVLDEERRRGNGSGAAREREREMEMSMPRANPVHQGPHPRGGLQTQLDRLDGWETAEWLSDDEDSQDSEREEDDTEDEWGEVRSKVWRAKEARQKAYLDEATAKKAFRSWKRDTLEGNLYEAVQKLISQNRVYGYNAASFDAKVSLEMLLMTDRVAHHGVRDQVISLQFLVRVIFERATRDKMRVVLGRQGAKVRFLRVKSSAREFLEYRGTRGRHELSMDPFGGQLLFSRRK